MKILLMRLKGPLQSWGTNSRFSLRDTDNFPSLSGVMGMLGSAMGYTRESKELIPLVEPLTIAVRIDKAGRRIRDYQIIDTGGSNGKKISERFYLADASFLVAVYDPEGKSDALLERASLALKNPANALYLGRKSCPPSEYIDLGVQEVSSVEQALKLFSEFESLQGKTVNAWIPGNSGKHATLIGDLPLDYSMKNRLYSTRLISQIRISFPEIELPKEIDPFDILEES